MPECPNCEGAGTVVAMPDGSTMPFYKAFQAEGYAINPQRKSICKNCDGWGRIDDAKPPKWGNNDGADP